MDKSNRSLEDDLDYLFRQIESVESRTEKLKLWAEFVIAHKKRPPEIVEKMERRQGMR